MILPVLRDQAGSMQKKWYVEYSYRNPHTDEMQRFRTYITSFSAKERYSEAKKIIKDITDKLESGWNPCTETKVVYEDQLAYRSLARKYGSVKSEIESMSYLISEFLKSKQLEVNDKTYMTYQSRLRIFYNYLVYIKKERIAIGSIDQEFVIEFLKYICSRDNLAHRTILKYQQILFSLFEFYRKKKYFLLNPVVDIPRIGRTVDMAAAGMNTDDRRELIDIIEKEDEQLYLACLFLYYCAIRPGQELRLLKVKDINFDYCLITIDASNAKNRQRETVSMPVQFRDLLREYRIDLCHKELYVFGKSGRPGIEPLGKNTLRNRFNRIRDYHGYSKDYKLYSWKHTGAQALKDADASPYEIQRHLRHKSFETTERYLRKRMGEMSDKIKKDFPDIKR